MARAKKAPVPPAGRTNSVRTGSARIGSTGYWFTGTPEGDPFNADQLNSIGIGSFTLGGQKLDEAYKTNPNMTKKEFDQTRIALEKILASNSKLGKNLLVQNSVLARPIQLVHGLNQIDPTRSNQLTAAAAYVSCAPENSTICRQCASASASGPFRMCIKVDSDFNAACFNCQYSGSANHCSFYSGTKGKGKAAATESDPIESILNSLEDYKAGTLEALINSIQEELDSRADGTPAGKKRKH
ncbi:uncharacterized protein B0I36DRAFT_9929 [Microdochium trichocladiopsis]|uniref:Uncharacterized protein n=1 Tax=Microdochium trichocladiopsis TaxID=1682393 RepID=A0A9P9BW40_9PEZI|nr:uncharacterized protein B0I36DRAFT_323615 [Microdochium trichocladiopsis]XP_046018462.1 uncharacterized protein B0I36DRAFT_9929 [Microdochium trichocladiopsis]KAH7031297.1 hypothetical protein B0I36DRAFT_323615 [Microdochium trichocladiopsis]KAH7040407.1 hypothetical protein B0I36DRAFT_9929 [Microdochium trichocladiopsis]